MTAPNLALRTPETVPGVHRLIEIARQMHALHLEQWRLSESVLDDAAFMDAPIRAMRGRDLTEAYEAPIGSLFHLNAFENEQAGWTDITGHRDVRCDRPAGDCEAPIGERIKRKWTRVGNRFWNTHLGSFVLIGKPPVNSANELYILAPLDPAASLAALADVEQLARS